MGHYLAARRYTWKIAQLATTDLLPGLVGFAYKMVENVKPAKMVENTKNFRRS